MKNFEDKLNRLEEIAESIRKTDVSLEDAVSYFEEGITLAKKLEKDLEKIENKVQILMNNPIPIENKPEISPFNELF
jgi:exodeoxyribonuclease VII small subunit